MSAPVYFTAPDGTVYRVLDVVMKEGHLHAGNPPASWAKSRVFRPKEGHRRLYRFNQGEDRSPTEDQLKRQFAVAEYMAAEPYDASRRTPR